MYCFSYTLAELSHSEEQVVIEAMGPVCRFIVELEHFIPQVDRILKLGMEAQDVQLVVKNLNFSGIDY